MRRMRLNRTNQMFFIILVLLPFVNMAGQINEISFDKSIITIRHLGCQPQTPLKEKTKLILRMGSCATKRGQISHFLHPNLKRIHWAQHDRKTVWIVVSFLNRTPFEIISFPHQYLVCFPTCNSSHFQPKQITEIKASYKMMFMLNGLFFQIPLEGMLMEDFLDRSIGFVPTDIIRDGLPHFGSKRDDWLNKSRKHLGYDIYTNQSNVIAAAAGTVTKVRRNATAGLYIKLHHGHRLYTLYIHLKTAYVEVGQKVKQGEIIGRIDGAVGNAVAPQLHFEIKPNNRSVDPIPLIEYFYQNDKQMIDKIKSYQKMLSKMISIRDNEVKKFLKPSGK